MKFYEILQYTIAELQKQVVPKDRKMILQPLVDYIQGQLDNRVVTNLNFICTHNSRRSHLAQIWAQTAAVVYGIPHVACYSGGTEATALFPQIKETLIGQGFQSLALSEGANPIYLIKYSDDGDSIISFSKTYYHPLNPVSNFAAVMTCDHADENCPFIPGAKRISVTYEDPKSFDGTPQQTVMYLERSRQIGVEMLYVFSKLKV